MRPHPLVPSSSSTSPPRPAPSAPQRTPPPSARARTVARDDALRRLLSSAPHPTSVRPPPSTGRGRRTLAGPGGRKGERGGRGRPPAARELVLEVVPQPGTRTASVQTDKQVEGDDGDAMGTKRPAPSSLSRSPLAATQSASSPRRGGPPSLKQHGGGSADGTASTATSVAFVAAPPPALPTNAGDLQRMLRELSARSTASVRAIGGERAAAAAAVVAAAVAAPPASAAGTPARTQATATTPARTQTGGTPFRRPGAAASPAAWRPTQASPARPRPVRLPAAGVDAVFERDFWKQADAFEWADAALEQVEAARRREAGGGDDGDGDATATTTTGLVAPDYPLKIFAVEYAKRADPSQYGRNYVVAGYAGLAAYYFSPPALARGRHWYEILRADRPVHAYFDLEYVPSLNPGADGDAMVDAVVAAFRRYVAATQSPALAATAAAYESDATGGDKWSRHLTIRLDGAAWRDTEAVGAVVDALLADAPTAAALTVRKPPPANAPPGAPPCVTSAIDTGVYTRNRNFRLLWSAKGGSDRSLRPTLRHAFAPGGALPLTDATPLWDVVRATLAADVPPGARLLSVAGAGGDRRRATVERTAAGRIPGEGRSVPVIVKLSEEEAAAGAPVPAALAEAALGAVPAVQRAVTALSRAQAHVVKVVLAGVASSVVSYNVQGPGGHWCSNSLARNGRPHKSNYAYYRVDLATGELQQRCFDGDCVGVKAPVGELPPEYRYLPPEVVEEEDGGEAA